MFAKTLALRLEFVQSWPCQGEIPLDPLRCAPPTEALAWASRWLDVWPMATLKTENAYGSTTKT